jgi:enoyl-CoA hydratase/carnithine racemase
MAADLGTLQIFPNIIGNESTFRELSYTGRWMDAQEAKSIGLVSKVFETREKMEEGLMETARSIASKSPVAINTLKHIFRR